MRRYNKDAGNDEWAVGKWGAYADPSSKERSSSGKESSSGSAAAGGSGGGGGGSGGGQGLTLDPFSAQPEQILTHSTP